MESGGRITVLVVDDQAIYHDVVARALRGDPAIEVVGLATSVEAAISEVRRQRPDVVVMDHMLPDGRGTDAAKRITHEFKHVRVVMVTAAADDKTVKAAKKAHCSGYVMKDRIAHDLLGVVQAAFRGESSDMRNPLSLFLPVDTDESGL